MCVFYGFYRFDLKKINDYDNSLCQLAYDAVEEYRHLFRRLAVLAIQPFAYHRISALITPSVKVRIRLPSASI